MKSMDVLVKQSTNTREKLLYSGIDLFSSKGYSNIGIRQLCTSVGIKESSFYNHYKSKENLFNEIMNLMVDKGDQILFSNEEVDSLTEMMSVESFMKENLRRIQKAFTNPVFMSIMRLVVMESYINPIAYKLSKNNSYDEVRDRTIEILKKYQLKGDIMSTNLFKIVEAYYHGLKTYNDTYTLNDAWGINQDKVLAEMDEFNQFYIDLLKGDIYEK